MLLDPLSDLRRQRAEYEWASRDSLRLDERYRNRQLPLLHARPRPPIGPEAVAPGEFWPPVRSIVLPLPDDILDAESMSALQAELRASDVAPLIWFEGLQTRAGKMHATLVPGVSIDDLDELDGPSSTTDAPGGGRGINVVVRGPWVGRFNTGRIYLPVQAADEVSAKVLSDIRRRCGAAHRPLQAGFLQLRDDVDGDQYVQLRRILADHQARVAIEVTLPELALTDTMDDLVLRSRVVGRIPLPPLPLTSGG